jgi:hypothetical protein
MLKLPKLYKKLGVHALEDLCDSMGLQARGGRGEHSPPGPNGEFDISNKGDDVHVACIYIISGAVDYDMI